MLFEKYSESISTRRTKIRNLRKKCRSKVINRSTAKLLIPRSTYQNARNRRNSQSKSPKIRMQRRSLKCTPRRKYPRPLNATSHLTSILRRPPWWFNRNSGWGKKNELFIEENYGILISNSSHLSPSFGGGVSWTPPMILMWLYRASSSPKTPNSTRIESIYLSTYVTRLFHTRIQIAFVCCSDYNRLSDLRIHTKNHQQTTIIRQQ